MANDNVSALLALIGRNGEGGSGPSGENTVTVTGTTPTIQAADNTLYLFSDAVTSITISSLPASGLFELVFLSGSTATEIIGPTGQSISLADGCEIAADMVNDVSIRVCSVGGSVMALATVGTWEAPAAPAAAT